MQVEGHQGGSLLPLLATGARVRNTYPICPRLRDSLSKERLTPDGVRVPHGTGTKDISAVDGDASD